MWALELWPVLVAGTFIGMVTWAMYIAVEPIGRQVWPQMFVSSSRLLSLQRIQWRDPLTGQSVLIGLILGTLLYAFNAGGPLRAALPRLQDKPPLLVSYDVDLWLGSRVAWGKVLDVAMDIGVGFVLVVTLVMLRLVFRKAWLAVGVSVIVWTVMAGAYSPGALAFGVVASSLLMAVLLRWGVVAMLVGRVIGELARNAPATDLSAWHSQSAAISLALIAVLAVYGVWAATGGEVIPEGTASTA